LANPPSQGSGSGAGSPIMMMPPSSQRPMYPSPPSALQKTNWMGLLDAFHRPLAAGLIVVLFSVPAFQRVVNNLVAGSIQEDGSYTFYGYLARGLVGAGLFFVAESWLSKLN